MTSLVLMTSLAENVQQNIMLCLAICDVLNTCCEMLLSYGSAHHCTGRWRS